jgi:hypothetical protein
MADGQFAVKVQEAYAASPDIAMKRFAEQRSSSEFEPARSETSLKVIAQFFNLVLKLRKEG